MNNLNIIDKINNTLSEMGLEERDNRGFCQGKIEISNDLADDLAELSQKEPWPVAMHIFSLGKTMPFENINEHFAYKHEYGILFGDWKSIGSNRPGVYINPELSEKTVKITGTPKIKIIHV